MPLSIGRYGQIQEWLEDYDEVEPGHRHMSHPFALFPGSQITPNRTSELAKAVARRSSGGWPTAGATRAGAAHGSSIFDGNFGGTAAIAECSCRAMPGIFNYSLAAEGLDNGKIAGLPATVTLRPTDPGAPGGQPLDPTAIHDRPNGADEPYSGNGPAQSRSRDPRRSTG